MQEKGQDALQANVQGRVGWYLTETMSSMEGPPFPTDSPQTISRRVALGLGLCLVILFLAFLGVKFQGR